MGNVKKGDFAGIRMPEGNVFCEDCMTEEEWLSLLPEDQFISHDAIVEDFATAGNMYFCDRCKKRL